MKKREASQIIFGLFNQNEVGPMFKESHTMVDRIDANRGECHAHQENSQDISDRGYPDSRKNLAYLGDRSGKLLLVV